MAASHKCKHIESKQRCCPVRTGGNYDNDRVRCRVIRFNERKENMTIRRVEIERLSVTSSKPFEVAVTALKAALMLLNMFYFVKETRSAPTFPESLLSDRYVSHSRHSIFDERL